MPGEPRVSRDDGEGDVVDGWVAAVDHPVGDDRGHLGLEGHHVGLGDETEVVGRVGADVGGIGPLGLLVDGPDPGVVAGPRGEAGGGGVLRGRAREGELGGPCHGCTSRHGGRLGRRRSVRAVEGALCGHRHVGTVDLRPRVPRCRGDGHLVDEGSALVDEGRGHLGADLRLEVCDDLEWRAWDDQLLWVARGAQAVGQGLLYLSRCGQARHRLAGQSGIRVAPGDLTVAGRDPTQGGALGWSLCGPDVALFGVGDAVAVGVEGGRAREPHRHGKTNESRTRIADNRADPDRSSPRASAVYPSGSNGVGPGLGSGFGEVLPGDVLHRLGCVGNDTRGTRLGGDTVSPRLVAGVREISDGGPRDVGLHVLVGLDDPGQLWVVDVADRGHCGTLR